MQRKPFRRLTAGRLSAPKYYRLDSEKANRQYLESCIPVSDLTESSAERIEAVCKGVVQFEELQKASCAEQTLKYVQPASLSKFCSKNTLLELKHSMQPQQQAVPELLFEQSSKASHRPPLHDFLELEAPIFAKVDASTPSWLHTREFVDTMHGTCRVQGT